MRLSPSPLRYAFTAAVCAVLATVCALPAALALAPAEPGVAPLAPVATGVLGFCLFCIAGAAFLFARPIIGAGAMVAATGLIGGLAMFFQSQGAAAPWVAWTLCTLLLFAAVYGWRFFVEDRPMRRLSAIFGHWLSPQRLALAEPKLSGELRAAAVMFTDLEGFTAFSTRNAGDPERAVARLNGLIEKIGDIVEEHGGYVAKVLGDGVMAVWGAPIASDQPAEEATRAALAIADAFDALALQSAAQRETPLRIRIGLSAGTVLAGALGPSRAARYTVLGEPANRAARLQEACGDQQAGILCDGDFARALDGAFETRAMPAVVLRTGEPAVETFAILRPSARAS